MPRLVLRVPVPLTRLAFALLCVASMSSADAANSDSLDEIDGFLVSAVPAYDVLRMENGILVSTCGTGDACVGMMNATALGLRQVRAGDTEFDAAGAEAGPWAGKVGAEVLGASLAKLLEEILKPEFGADVVQWFTRKYRYSPSAEQLAGLSKLQPVAHWGQRALAYAPYVYEGVTGLWATYRHLQAGDLEEATTEVTDTTFDMGAVWLCLKAAGIAGAKGTAVGGAAGSVIPGVGTAVGAVSGSVLFAVGAGLGCWFVADVATEKVSDVAGSWLYEKGGLYVDSQLERAKRDIDECVDGTDGFVEELCTVASITRAAACVGTLPCTAAMMLDFVTGRSSDSADPDGTVAVGAGTGDTSARAVNSGRGGGLPVVAGTPDGSSPGPGIHGASDRVRAQDLDIQVQVGGSVVTRAHDGGDSITRIGSTVQGADDVGGRYVTGIRGSVYNRGGILEVNPVGRTCEVVRDGRCCVEIHRGRCVIDKYKLSKKKKRKRRRCATGYKRSGSWCYEYSDRRHALGR